VADNGIGVRRYIGRDVELCVSLASMSLRCAARGRFWSVSGAVKQVDVDVVPDPDESGTDTFVRFRYQAHAAFLYCMDCALIGKVKSITPERFEDLLVEEALRWRLIQLKTRDAGYGLWLFGDLLGDSGALRSIVRTHKALVDFDDGREIAYEVHLEGAAKRGDDIEHLVAPHGAGATEQMVQRCAKRLKIEEDLARAVLERTIVRDQLPPREHIRDSNIRQLQRYAPEIVPSVTESVYDSIVGLTETAMRGELLADRWPDCAMRPDESDEELRLKIAGKRLTAETLGPHFDRLGQRDSSLLEVVTSDELLRASELDRKLMAAGASTSLRQHAKQLRANAARALFEVSSGSIADVSADLEDLDMRLLVAADSVAETASADPPADDVWKDVLSDFASHRDTLDPRKVLHRDPLFMAGRLCELSDLCRFGWGA
jgi:hypothetical protein